MEIRLQGESDALQKQSESFSASLRFEQGSSDLHSPGWRIMISWRQRRPSVNTPAAAVAIKRAFKREMRRASHNREETDGEEKKGRGRDEQKECLSLGRR